MKSIQRKTMSHQDEAESFGRQPGHYRLSGMEGKRGVDYFRGLLQQTDEKEFGFRGIESKILEVIQDEMIVIVD